ncbi:ribosomal-protein-L7/L12-serine acetyltransferase [Dictyobacter vulcani]|uniref:Ribosomal-protein-L7/L12-serine acetyltransferase n=1 Tax=Dictyobacter vulcani TaxID=2607529 RepID=A0A5J4KXK1_9CHLR|nr:GNAT family N-acetyltransferase [Dictyobacter vulcani]GER91211.1 ribosomal-protein-L7/L12-serine acetyltransferase [Dictyobacter vulcani]
MSNVALKIPVDDEIELRLNEAHYTDEYLALTLRNLEYLQEWMAWAAFEQTHASMQAYMKGSMQQFVDGTALPTNLWYRGQLVGSIGYPRIIREKSVGEIGYWLSQDMQGRGIITRACRTLVTYGFQEYGLNKIEIRAAVGNKPSRAVAERLGFTQEGILRQVDERLHEPMTWFSMYARQRVAPAIAPIPKK